MAKDCRLFSVILLFARIQWPFSVIYRLWVVDMLQCKDMGIMTGASVPFKLSTADLVVDNILCV